MQLTAYKHTEQVYFLPRCPVRRCPLQPGTELTQRDRSPSTFNTHPRLSAADIHLIATQGQGLFIFIVKSLTSYQKKIHSKNALKITCTQDMYQKAEPVRINTTAEKDL